MKPFEIQNMQSMNLFLAFVRKKSLNLIRKLLVTLLKGMLDLHDLPIKNIESITRSSFYLKVILNLDDYRK